MLRIIAVFLGAVCLLSACTVTPLHVAVTPVSVSFAPEGLVVSPAAPRHCPPEQAQKGWC